MAQCGSQQKHNLLLLLAFACWHGSGNITKQDQNKNQTEDIMTTTAKTKTKAKTMEHANVALEVSKGTLVAMSAVPTLIGIWAAACFVGGLINAGGPFVLAKSWFQAVTGM